MALNFDGPGMSDHWRALLGNEPFNVSQEEIGQLTNREIWEWYLKLGLERSKKLNDLQNNPQAGSDGEVLAPETPEEIEFAMNMLKAMWGGKTFAASSEPAPIPPPPS
jgi:hypothetical protein